ncbi:MAG: hypothetical protein V7K73_21770 [Nostoc sp.]
MNHFVGENTTDLKLYCLVDIESSVIYISQQMPNPKGNPQNFEPIKSDREEPLDGKITIRVTKSMEKEVKTQDNPPQFCRDAIQEALDKKKKE